MKKIRMFRFLFAFLTVALVLLARAAVADLEIKDGPLSVAVGTTLDNKTIRYEGHNHAIRDNLTLKNTTYLRLKGGSKTTPDTLSFGPADNAAANQHPVVSIQENSGFYATYRNGDKEFLDDPTDKSVVQSYLTVNVGEHGGSGLFLVQSVGGSFSSSIKLAGLWLWQLTVSENATSDGDYIDILQLDSGGVADIDSIVVNSDKPARIIFNGGAFRDNQQTRGEENPFQPSKGRTLTLEGVNGNDIRFDKSYVNHSLNGGAGILRIQGDCDFIYTEEGGVWGSNRRRLDFGKNGNGVIEWNITGDFILGKNAWTHSNSNDALPTNIVIRMRSNSVIDLDGNVQHLKSLVSESADAMVTNALEAASTGSTLVFGADDRDCIFSACCTANVDVEKIGAGILVVSNATVEGTITIKEGAVKFVGINSLPNMIIEEGAEVLVDCVESSDSIKRLDIGSQFLGKVFYEYDSAGEMLLRAGDELGGMRLNVKNGSVRFAGDCSDKFWRLVMLKAANVSETACKSSTGVEMNEFSLYASNITTRVSKGSQMLNYNLKTNETGMAWTTYSQMTSGTCTEGFGEAYKWNPNVSGRVWWGVDALCCDKAAACFSIFGSPSLSESSPRHIVYRLNDDAPAVSSYMLGYTQWSIGGVLKKWRLESSVDGETWTVRDEHEAQWADTSDCSTDAEKRAKSELPTFACSTAGYYNNGVPYRFTQGASMAESFTNVRVSVAFGAKLDTTYINDSVLSFSELNVDGEGGTITKFAPAVNGRLNLSNVALSTKMKKVMTVPNVINPKNLDTWKVCVDGVENSGVRIKIVDGELLVGIRPGIILIVR